MNDIHTIATGIGLGESARWHDGRLWFADWIAGTVEAIQANGEVREIARVSSFPVSFDWLPDGRMLVVSGADGQVFVAHDGALTPYCDLRDISKSAWNEIVTDDHGNAYVNGIGFDFPGPPQVAGIIARITPDGVATVMATDLAFPNGMLITPDGAVLVVAESHAGRLTAFDIRNDGTLAGRRTWAAVDGSAPDGICLDPVGNIWFAEVPGKRCVLVTEGGGVVQVLEFAQSCFDCALGGEHGATLFAMTADWPAAMDPTGPRTGNVRAIAVSS